MNIALKERLSRGPSIMDNLRDIASSYDDIETPPPVAIKCVVYAKCRTESECTAARRCLDAPMRSASILTGLEAALTRKPLDEIAMLVRALTYGEMMELAEGFWKARKEGEDITQATLPSVLHRWATNG